MKQRKTRIIETNMIKTKPAALVLAAVLLASGILQTGAVHAWAYPTSGICTSDEVSVREEPVEGKRIDYIYEGQEVEILDEEEGSDGYIWYQVTYEIDEVEYEGWLRSDFLDTSEAADSEDDDEEEEEEAVEEEEEGLSFITYAGIVTLEDVPEEVAALVSDRFVSAELTLSAGTVTAYQLLVADDLVEDGASILDFYYVYGTDEDGESGWYVYDEEQGTLQRSTLNMEYTIESGSSATLTFHGFEFTYNLTTLLVMGVLAVLFVVFFVLTIANGARCRRLKKALRRAESNPSEPVPSPQTDTPAPSGRFRSTMDETESEEEEYDFPLDADEEQEQESRSTGARKSEKFTYSSGGSTNAGETPEQEVESLFRDAPVSEGPKDELEELERILSRELMSRDWESTSDRSRRKNNSGESQSEDDDMEFL